MSKSVREIATELAFDAMKLAYLVQAGAPVTTTERDRLIESAVSAIEEHESSEVARLAEQNRDFDLCLELALTGDVIEVGCVRQWFLHGAGKSPRIRLSEAESEVARLRGVIERAVNGLVSGYSLFPHECEEMAEELRAALTQPVQGGGE
jgi:hypothetical protein